MVAGEGAARGVTAILNTDQVRNLPAALNDVADDLATLIPYRGLVTATTDSNGVVTVTHGLGFTPSFVWCQSSAGHISMLVDTRNASTFRTKWCKQSGTTIVAVNAESTTFYWLALR